MTGRPDMLSFKSSLVIHLVKFEPPTFAMRLVDYVTCCPGLQRVKLKNVDVDKHNDRHLENNLKNVEFRLQSELTCCQEITQTWAMPTLSYTSSLAQESLSSPVVKKPHCSCRFDFSGGKSKFATVNVEF